MKFLRFILPVLFVFALLFQVQAQTAWADALTKTTDGKYYVGYAGTAVIDTTDSLYSSELDLAGTDRIIETFIDVTSADSVSLSCVLQYQRFTGQWTDDVTVFSAVTSSAQLGYKDTLTYDPTFTKYRYFFSGGAANGDSTVFKVQTDAFYKGFRQ